MSTNGKKNRGGSNHLHFSLIQLKAVVLLFNPARPRESTQLLPKVITVAICIAYKGIVRCYINARIYNSISIKQGTEYITIQIHDPQKNEIKYNTK